jgi:hypothetical protein
MLYQFICLSFYVIIFVRCVEVRCVSAALVDGDDKPPCATGRVRNRAVIITWKCRYFHVFKIVFVSSWCAHQISFRFKFSYVCSHLFKPHCWIVSFSFVNRPSGKVSFGAIWYCPAINLIVFQFYQRLRCE